MKKTIMLAVIILSILVLSGCDYIEKDHFAFYNGYKDEEVKYFDEYAIVYQNSQYNLTLYAVRDKTILDTNGDEFVNYVMDWDIREVSTLFLSCGYYNLYGGSRGWSPGGMNSHLIPGQEVYDYCTDYDTLKLSLPNEEEVIIQLYKDINSSELNWEEVSSINENSFAIFFRDNSSALLYVSIAIVIAVFLSVGYTVIYRKNYNNFTKGLRVRKLLRLGTINVLLAIILVFSSIIIVQENEPLIHRYESNFYDYELQEDSVYYLPIFENEGYTLIGAKGNQEVYIEVESDDLITFYYVLVDNDTRYIREVFMGQYPDAGVYDEFRVDLYQKESSLGGLIFGHVVAQYVDGEQVYASSYGVTERIDGETVFVDFIDSNMNGWTEYSKNIKGYYMVNVIVVFDYNNEE